MSDYIVPETPPVPVEDADLEDFLGDLIAGVTGLDRDTVVRPSWQEEPPNQEDREVQWVAFRIQSEEPDTYAAGITYDTEAAGGAGGLVLQHHETIEVLVSAYGPSAQRTQELLRNGLQIEQNRWSITAAGMGLVGTGSIIAVPLIDKSKWLMRRDMTITLRRNSERVYKAPFLSGADILIRAEAGVGEIDNTVTVPTP